ncbi:MAG: hypothetical protein A3H06_01995 [Candidatus Colwellbacteria bacterium RIFCSPLOWO2_12_FULL_44_13]|uniref:Membrane insertase YidC/Oxa/ALB C-terminal domain-containing protein n=3 Tax=Candidatus Colwelliibacteriota TaxID=1817904 RepID=A0A1G1Z4C5_9BACT|nr:MAG: hypothetical protein A3F24_02695 [Candidatus Colwellbacteria bacterium RIFCSPHIGHO2_12_FULL_44_17]OGY59482.1 MAG: hypothetical protein A3I31_03110 [Candidatus Colwellbacteria bacterium RIFCSPLOWO2_02_FULL_44_20b]OGY61486.1 MAG: hypothetical protein A3H06_01995 [Candidatus Colwellbacteria bacterium RIFCSPLOWO2_12_FULL_44_13]
MAGFFNTVIFVPLLNALVEIYNTIAFQDLGIAIIFLTILVRIILFPLAHKSTKHQTIMQRLQPRIKEIQEKHKDDKEKQTQAMLELFKEHKVNPFSGFFILFLQLPVLWALYKLFMSGLDGGVLENLYSFVAKPEVINHMFLGLLNLSETSMVVVGLAAAAQYLQGQIALPKIEKGKILNTAEKTARRMVLIGPVATIAIFLILKLPAAVGLYWITQTAFQIFQQVYINKSLKNGERHNNNQTTA